MNDEIKKKELRDTAAGMLPDIVITMAFVEHQMDLMAQILVDMAEDANLSPEKQERVEMLRGILVHSSINFEKITEPLEAYKIPKTIDYKLNTRQVQGRYLQAQVKAGLFG